MYDYRPTDGKMGRQTDTPSYGSTICNKKSLDQSTPGLSDGILVSNLEIEHFINWLLRPTKRRTDLMPDLRTKAELEPNRTETERVSDKRKEGEKKKESKERKRREQWDLCPASLIRNS